VIFLPILANIWLLWQRHLDHCSQKCLLWIGQLLKSYHRTKNFVNSCYTSEVMCDCRINNTLVKFTVTSRWERRYTVKVVHMVDNYGSTTRSIISFLGPGPTWWPPCRIRVAPLFNAAKFSWRPLLECRAVTLSYRETRWNLLWWHVGEILLFNKFFPIVDTCLSSEDTARQSCLMVHRRRIFGDFLSPVFQRAPCSTFQTCILTSHSDHSMCGSMVDIQRVTTEIRRRKKKERRKNNKQKWQKSLALWYGFMVDQSKKDISDCKRLRDVAMATKVGQNRQKSH